MKWKLILVLIVIGIVPLVNAGIIEDIIDFFWIGEEDEYADYNLNSSFRLTTEREFNSQKYQTINTEYIDFDLPYYATHYWINNGLDIYEIIINVSIEGYDDYFLKYNWNDNRYLDESFQIFYDFNTGILNKEDISFNKLSKDGKLTFQNMNIQKGEIIGYNYERDGVFNVSYPIYSWSEFDKIDLKNNSTFRAIDDIEVDACGTLGIAGETYILNTSIVTTTTCFTITANNITLDGAGFDIFGDLIGTDFGITAGGLTNITIKNFQNISNFSRGIGFSMTTSDSFIINNTISFSVQGIRIIQGDDNQITDTNISDSSDWDVFLQTAAQRNIFLNVDYNESKEFVSPATKVRASSLTRRWHYIVYVNDTLGNPVDNATIRIGERGGASFYETVGITNSSGDFSGSIRDYFNNGGVKTINPLGELRAFNSSSIGYNSKYVKGESLYDDFITIDFIAPNISFDSTTDNLTTEGVDFIFVNVSISDNFGNISSFIDFDGSLVSWWRMDDVFNGSVRDFFNRNNGTAVDDAIQTDAGRLGRGFFFDGVGDFINISDDDSLEGMNELTVSTWFKEKSNPVGRHTIIAKSDYLTTTVFFMRTSDSASQRIRWRISNGIDSPSCQSDTPPTLNVWHHIVGVYNGTDSIAYLDGVEICSVSANIGALNTNIFPVRIGKSSSIGADSFNGTIDDVMIFNRSLNPDEIKSLFANQTSRQLQVNFTNLAEGEYTFKAYSQDFAGNLNMTEERIVEVPCWSKIGNLLTIPNLCVYEKLKGIVEEIIK